MNKDTLKLHMQIAERAQQKGLCHFDKLSLLMDLEAAQIAFDIDCKRLLEADDFNFAHDIIGIQNYINRTKTDLFSNEPHVVFENCFVPRFARA